MIGETVAEYRVEAVVGRGGMGTVYRALDTALEKTVALKMIAPRLAEDPSFLGRFRAEARALARLDDPGIVRVHALRESVKGVFIVMEYIEGEPLGTFLRRRGALAPGEALALFLPVLRAVAHAHGAGVLHRDLKPSNLIVPQDYATDGTSRPVKITDFGLAKIRAADTHLTATHDTAGTTGYMAPEQIEGLRAADERSDLFAVGMMLYEALAGRLPFDREQTTFVVQRHIVEEPFAPPSAFADVPDDLSSVVMQSLAKDPAERYPSAEAMYAALQSLSDGAGGHDVPLPASPGSDRAPRSGSSNSRAREKQPLWQHPALTTALLCTLGFVLLGGALYAVRSFLPAPSPSSSRAAQAESARPAGEKGPADPVAARLSVRSDPTGAAVYLNGDSAGATPLAAAPVPPGSVRVRLRRSGFADLDTAMLASAGTGAALSLRLTPSSSDAADELLGESRPGRSRARTTRSDGAGSDEARSATRSAPPRSKPPPQAERSGDERENAEARPAILSVRVAPWGTLAIDGRIVFRQSAVFHADTLAPGPHTLVATHPQLGGRRVEVNLSPGFRGERVINLRTAGDDDSAPRP